MARIYNTGTAAVGSGGTTVTITGGSLSVFACVPDAPCVVNGYANFVASRTDTTHFELRLPQPAAFAGTGLAYALFALVDDETDIAVLNERTADLIQKLSILDANSQGLFLTYAGTSGIADPGNGNIKLNNATAPTEAYISKTDARGLSIDAIIGLFNINTFLNILPLDRTDTYVAAQVKALPIDNTTYFRLLLAPVDHDGTLGVSDQVNVFFAVNGSGLDVDAQGVFTGRAAFNAQVTGFTYLSTDGAGGGTIPLLYRKNSATSGDWSAGAAIQGLQGDRGWSPQFSTVVDGERVVDQLVAWVGGTGTAPTNFVGQYRLAGGFTANIALATDVRGPRGRPNGLDMKFSTNTTTAADPGTGFVRVNSGTISSVTEICFDGSTVTTLLSTSVFAGRIDDVVNAVYRGKLVFQRSDSSEFFAEFLITGASIDGGAGAYFRVPAVYLGGALPANNDLIHMDFTPSGSDGANGIISGLRMTFDGASVADSDPGTGKVRFDNATLGSVTKMFFDNTDPLGVSIASVVDGWDDVVNTTSKGKLRGEVQNTPDVWVEFNVVGTVVDGTGYRKVSVTGGAGAIPTNGLTVIWTFTRSGNDGTDIAAAVHGASVKAVPDDADEILVLDSTGGLFTLAKTTITNLKAKLKTYFDTLYAVVHANLTALSGVTAAADKMPRWTSGTSMDAVSAGSVGVAMLAATSFDEVQAQFGMGSRRISYATAGTYIVDGDDYFPGAHHVAYASGATVNLDVSALLLYREYIFFCYDTTTIILDSSGGADIFFGSGILASALTTSLTMRPGSTLRLFKVAGGRLFVEYVFARSGVYTPGTFNTTNMAASTAFVTGWSRNGDVVTVAGILQMDVTAGSTTTLMGMALPVPSPGLGTGDLGGVAFQSSGNIGGFAITADTVNKRASFTGVCSATTANQTYGFMFQYLVV